MDECPALDRFAEEKVEEELRRLTLVRITPGTSRDTIRVLVPEVLQRVATWSSPQLFSARRR